MRLFFFVPLIAFALPAVAQDLTALERPGAIAIMRHALAPEDGEERGTFDLADCSTQRNLDAAGRDQARRIGAALREAAISFDRVWTSEYCRASETAELLGIGAVTEVESLNPFPEGELTSPEQTEDVLARLAALPGSARVMLVTHQTNIVSLTALSVKSGEIVAATLDGSGGLSVIDRIYIAP